MRISLFRDGYQNTTSTETIEDWDELCDLLTTPVVGQKNGDYFIRGYCDGTRKDENVKGVSVIVIDGDQTLDNGASCVPILQAHDSIKNAGITHIIYNSFSNDIVNNINKWRLVVPCQDIVCDDSNRQAIEEILSVLHADGLMVRNVKENEPRSQPWFTPRAPEYKIDEFEFFFHDGNEYRLTGKTTKSAQMNHSVKTKTDSNDGIFSWENCASQFKAGTLHQGLKSAAGWMIFSTDWADSQIKQMLSAMILSCPDKDKIKRAVDGGEIDSLLRYCRGKQGTDRVESKSWKDHLINADKLKDKEFPEIKWAVDSLIPEGLTILAGDPKAGKSLLICDICASIASGCAAFGQQKCVKGDVVYVSLEDPQRRVKTRIEKQHDLWPETFHLVTGGIPHIGIDFFKILDEMILLWPGVRLMAFDTLQLIMPVKAAGLDDYAHYYKQLDPLHSWALNNNIAVVCITHKSKAKHQDGDNPFAGIIGSVAIQGTSDAMVMLSKNRAKEGREPNGDGYIADGFLTVTGREIEENVFPMEFDDEALKWTMHAEFTGREATGNTNWFMITEELKKCGEGKGLTPTELANTLHIKNSTIKSCLGRMKKKGFVFNKNGKWMLGTGVNFE